MTSLSCHLSRVEMGWLRNSGSTSGRHSGQTGAVCTYSLALGDFAIFTYTETSTGISRVDSSQPGGFGGAELEGLVDIHVLSGSRREQKYGEWS